MRYGIIIVTATLLLVCSCNQQGTVMTVTGPVDATEMGVTLPHEHVMVDWVGADSSGPHRWDKDSVVDRVLPFMMEIKELGCNTFIDCSPTYLGKDPVILRELSEKSGLLVVTNTGYYGAHQNKFIPDFAHEETAAQLAERWIAEWENGIEGTAVKPGIIKIGVDGKQPLSEMHEKLVRAAALAHLSTGLPIACHTGPETTVRRQVDILREEGVAPGALIWTHAQGGTRESHLEFAREGVWVSLDGMNKKPETVTKYVRMLQHMKENELLDRVLLSHDAGWYDVGQVNGGGFRPYTSIFTELLPALREAGFSQADINQLMVDNPRKAYTIGARKTST